MTNSDYVQIIICIVGLLGGALIYSEQRRSSGYTKGVKELLEEKMDRHDDKNVQQDKHMDIIDAKIESHLVKLVDHDIRLHDVEGQLSRKAAN